MKLFTNDRIRAWDARTIEGGIPSIELMEKAANGLMIKLLPLISSRTRLGVFAGPGNNGGDALALVRLLKERGISSVKVFVLAHDLAKLSADCKTNLDRLESYEHIDELSKIPTEDQLDEYDLIIDGIFGSGLTRPIEGMYAECVERINQSVTKVISIDIPSGANPDRIDDNSPVVQAEHVLTLQIPKRVFLFPESERFMKGFEIVDIHLDKDFHDSEQCSWSYLTEEDILPVPRFKFDHKGKHGHTLIIAGSHGMYGAAQLCGRAALRAGSGLVTIHSSSEALPILQSALPEAMFSSDKSLDKISKLPELGKYSAIACGPGIGLADRTVGMLDNLLDQARVPLILDADALNIIAKESWQHRIPKKSVITPHPREFERLFGSSDNGMMAIELQQSMARDLDITILRKGAHSSIAFSDGRVFFNSTGNSFMATGGMGDVLTGIIAGLVAQGLRVEEATLTATFLHGHAADTALVKRRGGALMSRDIIESFRLPDNQITF